MDLHSNDKTPKRLILNSLSLKKTPITTPKNFVSRFNLLANNNGTQTPSPLLKSRVVRNPFENQLHERLHAPVVFSPSLFHAPSTPKQSSGKFELFEWTIEELSTLNPVNVIPHETQFREEEDPEREAEAQAKISSFFAEHQIVPSPQNCPRRAQKIQLRSDDDDDQIYNSTALPEVTAESQRCHMISKPSEIKVKRDIMTQTALSFPPNLPKEIEDLLKKYQLDNDGDDGNCNNTLSNNDNDEDRSDMMDISTLRRKLFIKPPESPKQIICYDDAFALHLSPAPGTPELTRRNHNHQDGDNSLSSDMFGEISPISLSTSFNHSSPMSSPNVNDISMASEVGGSKRTPASRRFNRLKKKNLSTSFSMLQDEFNEDDAENDKENSNFQNAMRPKLTEPRRFARFDSGFSYSESSNSFQLNLSTEFMQI